MENIQELKIFKFSGMTVNVGYVPMFSPDAEFLPLSIWKYASRPIVDAISHA